MGPSYRKKKEKRPMIPFSHLQPPGQRSGEPPVEWAEGTRARIMVIDDSQTVRTLLRVGLTRVGFTVNSFQSGIDALRELRQGNVPPPDLLLLDIGLPLMDGYAVARWLKQTPPYQHIPVVMVTRRNGVVDRLKARLAGASGYLTKPFKIDVVIDVVAEQLTLGAVPHLYSGATY
jgi:twitching motility two-component system response regulator PilG